MKYYSITTLSGLTITTTTKRKHKISNNEKKFKKIILYGLNIIILKFKRNDK